MEFLTVNNFFCVFKNNDQKNICAYIVIKAKSKPKHEEKHFLRVFFKNQKLFFSGVLNGTFLKSNFIFVFLRFFFNVKGSSMPIFIKKILIFGPPGIFVNVNFDSHAQKIQIWTFKIIPDLWLVDLFWLIKKNFHTPPYWTGVPGSQD